MTGHQAGLGPAGSGPVRTPDAPQTDQRLLRRRVGHADLSAVHEIRRELRELLGPSRHSGALDVAELLTSELVTNALVHTDHGAVVTATVGEAGLRVEVRDFVAALPTPHAPSADDGTHGRGLLLVQALADAWGVHEHGMGKVVWFELGKGTTP
ncbi:MULTISPECIES: ATP-binding protein [unclassified Streptomyces]|uniref:ATP-binding protein n=1 Tax=unclassified Streptomyces TaxID=2593676 RepID=UPI003800F692